ncbi:MAG TPA: ATP-binding protein [Candidatus Limnocylindria bacterium]|nr:ATP-binding protein [Candidatus Limnocylindria bacterium]
MRLARPSLLTLQVRYEQDVVLARGAAREVASLLGFDAQDQSRITTSVSEIVRNAFRYAGGGKVEFAVSADRPMFVVTVSDAGHGIPDLARVLDGRYRSKTGMGLGIVGSRRLMDHFEIASTSDGTTVTLGMALAGRSTPITTSELAGVGERLARRRPRDAYEEIQRQNQELLQTLEELHLRKSELEQVNRELEDTNRGVVALYAELDEKADSLQRANELKTRFLSNMTHEFRTPLNSVLSLSRLLLDRVDGELTPEQEKQVQFIRRSAEELSELVNDLLDIAKVEAGKIVVRPAAFEVADLFGALRGMLRPLLAANASISLVFDEPAGLPTMVTDEGKVSQILRNLISNALKFTERGEVRVRAELDGDRVVFSVADTGIGIAPEDQDRIFEEFVQLDSRLQQRSKGTGLGLPLSRKLAELLGGSVSVTSELGRGSTFTVRVPAEYGGPRVAGIPAPTWEIDPTRETVLVVEDSPETVFTYEKLLKGTGFQVVSADTVERARELLRHVTPVAITLDVLLQEESTWDLLAELKGDPATASIPVLVVTVVDNQKKAVFTGADAFAVKPVDRAWLLQHLRAAQRRSAREKVLIVDDDDVSRYVLQSLLADTRFAVVQASSAAEGLRKARTERPTVVIVDLAMPDLPGEEVIRRLKADPETRDIPVIVCTSRPFDGILSPPLNEAVAILSKDARDREAATAALRDALARALSKARATEPVAS